MTLPVRMKASPSYFSIQSLQNNQLLQPALKAIEALTAFLYRTFQVPIYQFRCVISKMYRSVAFRIVMTPLDYLIDSVVDVYDSFRFQAEKAKAPNHFFFTPKQIKALQKTYWALGSQKWKEGVESCFWDKGKFVFDQGLHKGTIEPGFHRSWMRAAHFLSHQFERKLTPELYLKTHEIALGHCLGDLTGHLIRADGKGSFRDVKNASVYEAFSREKYPLTSKAYEEIQQINLKMKKTFGVEFGYFKQHSPTQNALHRYRISKEKIKEVFSTFSDQLYVDLANAKNDREKIKAIAHFFRHMELLHPLQDGTGRCNLLTLNFLLVQNGFNPVVLDNMYYASVGTEEGVIQLIEKGMQDWRKMAKVEKS